MEKTICMKKASHLEEYVKVLNVLSSCKTQAHVKSARIYFDLYLSKWEYLFSKETLADMSIDFKIIVAKKLSTLIPE